MRDSITQQTAEVEIVRKLRGSKPKTADQIFKALKVKNTPANREAVGNAIDALYKRKTLEGANLKFWLK